MQNEYFTGKLRIEYPDVRVTLPNIVRAMDAAAPPASRSSSCSTSSRLRRRSSHAAARAPNCIRKWKSARDLQVEKSVASALTGTPLAAWLKARGIDTLSIVGYMTHNCDDSTARQAHHEGWKVELLHDASGSLPYRNAIGAATAEEIHRVFTVVMHTGFAAVASTDDWLAAVQRGEALQPDNVFPNQRALTAA